MNTYIFTRCGEINMIKLARTIIRKLPLLALILLLYIIIGATVPFAFQPDVSEAYSESINEDDFFGCNETVDRVMLLETNESALDERIRLINMAKQRIILSTFDFRADESGKDMMAVLLNAADRGINVKILVDGFSSMLYMDNNPYFIALSCHPNIEIKIYNRINLLKPWTIQGRMHDKYLLVDDIGYILGGRNTYDLFLGNYETKHGNYDRDVLVYNTSSKTDAGKDSSLYRLEEYFNAIWALDICTLYYDNESLALRENVSSRIMELKERYDGIRSNKSNLFCEYSYDEVTYPTKKITLLSNPTGIYSKEPRVYHSLIRLMKNADENVVLHSPYVVCNETMYRDLSDICRMVPDVRMVINSVTNGSNPFTTSDYARNKDDLIKTGIDIYEYDGGRSYHAKTILIDDELSIIGSFNFDMRSTYIDTELMLVIDSRELNEELKYHMGQIEKDCRMVIDKDTYYYPEDLEVAEMTLRKKILVKALSTLLIPFRHLI
jgi:putative cardiolipin synthase